MIAAMMATVTAIMASMMYHFNWSGGIGNMTARSMLRVAVTLLSWFLAVTFKSVDRL